jgi:hypothetical protein
MIIRLRVEEFIIKLIKLLEITSLALGHSKRNLKFAKIGSKRLYSLLERLILRELSSTTLKRIVYSLIRAFVVK